MECYYECVNKEKFKEYIKTIPKEKLAMDIGVSPTTVWRWQGFTDDYFPSKENIKKIIEKYNIKDIEKIGLKKEVQVNLYPEAMQILKTWSKIFTQEKLGKMLDYSPGMISKWLKGVEPLTEEASKKILEYAKKNERVDIFRYSYESNIPNTLKIGNIDEVIFGKCYSNEMIYIEGKE